MRRRTLLLTGAVMLVLACGKDSTGVPQPDPKPRPQPPATGAVTAVPSPDTTVAVQR